MRSTPPSLRPNSKVWVYGNGGFARELSHFLVNQGVEIVGYISQGRFYMNSDSGGEELYHANKHPIVIGVFNHKDDPQEIVEHLDKIGCDNYLSPGDICLLFPNSNFHKYYLDSSYLNNNIQQEMKEISARLSDDFSREVFSGFINYQTTGNFEKIVPSAGITLQYLGKTLPTPFDEYWLEGNLRWLDIGSFDGDTMRAIQSSGRFLGKDKFLCIEPDAINFKSLEECVNKLEIPAELMNVAIGSSPGEIEFVNEGTLSAGIKTKGLKNSNISKVQLKTIDEVSIGFTPTHIKMDIEGAEMEALLGGSKTLQSVRPKLAISLYHLPQDITRIPLFLMKLLPNYSWFMRCYGAHGYDTILYGLPNATAG